MMMAAAVAEAVPAVVVAGPATAGTATPAIIVTDAVVFAITAGTVAVVVVVVVIVVIVVIVVVAVAVAMSIAA